MKTYIITPDNRDEHVQTLSDMFAQRKHIFVDQLKWSNMTLIDGGERDLTDTDPNTEYLATLLDDSKLVGACRLAPTLGNCLLAGPLAHYLTNPLPRSHDAWELTRFAPATDAKDPLHGRSFAGLSAGVLEWGLRRGVTKIFGIAEPPLMAIAGGLGWKVVLEGPPIEFEKGKAAFAFSFPVDEETLASTRHALRLRGPVIADAHTQIEAAA
jgi:N-acyl-L-homoserine lactone synthetase